jgi:hypothetical protein
VDQSTTLPFQSAFLNNNKLSFEKETKLSLGDFKWQLKGCFFDFKHRFFDVLAELLIIAYTKNLYMYMHI